MSSGSRTNFYIVTISNESILFFPASDWETEPSKLLLLQVKVGEHKWRKKREKKEEAE